jgi:hypothetical protein
LPKALLRGLVTGLFTVLCVQLGFTMGYAKGQYHPLEDFPQDVRQRVPDDSPFEWSAGDAADMSKAWGLGGPS